MSFWDWVGVVLFVPLLLALAILIVYIIIGLLGSNKRRRQVAIQRAAEAREAAARPAAKPRRREPSQAPLD